MTTKNTLLTGVTGTITPTVDTNSMEVTDPTEMLTYVVELTESDDSINVVRRNAADDDWEPFTVGNRQLNLNIGNLSFTPLERGVYAIAGEIRGSLTAYTLGP